MVLPEEEDGGFSEATLYHELGHYYFGDGMIVNGHPWFHEGGAEFLSSYTLFKTYGETFLQERKKSVQNWVEECQSRGVANIYELNQAMEAVVGRTGPFVGCNYSMGENFFLETYETLGKAATTAALRELFLLSTSRFLGFLTEEEIYRTFLSNTPSGKEDEFRDAYRRLHGGPILDPAD